VPIPAFAVLIASIWVFSLLVPVVDPTPGGGLIIFWIALAAFAGISAWAIWGPDRVAAHGEADAFLDLRLAFASRLAIHGLFLVALLWLGLATSAPVLLGVALLMLAAEWPLAVIVRRRRATVRT
jgi:hypothetical protein